MASFTDELIPFNPYIQQLPVDDYVRVGMIKQQQYNQGVQKVQSYIDSVAGIEVIKAEQKDYLQKRVGQLQGEVSKIVQRDFSNQQLVNSVGTLTSKIASDPIIQGAEISTRRYKAAVGKMKDSQQKGTSAPSNEWHFQKQVNSWLGDGDVSTVFSGDYTPHTDVGKKVLDVIKELDPNSTLEDIPYRRGPGGNIILDKDGMPEIDYAMMQKSVKGVTPERIQAAIRASLDTNDMRQLNIDGTYNYRDMDKTSMKGIADESYNYRLGQINDTIKSLLVDRQTNQSNPTHVAEVDRKIQMLQDRAKSYQDNYRKEIQSLDNNLDGYKSNLYMQNWLTRFGDGFAYAENSLTYKENPFFMAAERRRENDIKFQEFIVNKQFEAMRIGLERERVNIAWEQLGINRMEAEAKGIKKGVGLDGAPLTLTGAAVREAIDQEQLEAINTSKFLDETQQMAAQIDNQKMALLAQTRPDLVKVVRSPDGTTPRYEYSVAGKDPNTVKGEAEATVLKFKESYDKGEQVPDGVKTYFDNLATTERRMQNRKAAINGLQNEADQTWNIKPLLDKVAPLDIGGGETWTAQQQVDFNIKMKQVSRARRDEKGVTSTEVDWNRANKILTPSEQRVARLMQFDTDVGLAGQQKDIWRKLNFVKETVNRPAETIVNNRNTYMNNAVRGIVGASQPTSFVVQAFKQEDQGGTQAVVANLLNSIVKEGKENPNPLYDQDDLSSMLSKTNSANTTYSLVSYGGDRYSLRASNTSVSDKPVEVDINKAQAQDLFGANQFLDNFQAIREALQLTKGTGRVSTDVDGTGRGSAFTLKNSALKKYGVMYHVEEPLKDGGLQAKLYVYDKTAVGPDGKEQGQWIEKTANFGQLLTEAQITKFLSMVGDQYIDSLLQK